MNRSNGFGYLTKKIENSGRSELYFDLCAKCMSVNHSNSHIYYASVKKVNLTCYANNCFLPTKEYRHLWTADEYWIFSGTSHKCDAARQKGENDRDRFRASSATLDGIKLQKGRFKTPLITKQRSQWRDKRKNKDLIKHNLQNTLAKRTPRLEWYSSPEHGGA